MRRLIAIACCLPFSVMGAEQAPAMPEPLSLQQAMEYAEDPQHFQLLLAQADLTRAQQLRQFAESEMGFRAQLELEAAYIEPSSVALDQTHNDSSATLRLTKPLYDFSGSYDRVDAATLEQDALQENINTIILQRKIDIARRFFEVILSDLKYAWDNEAMAIAYVRFEADKDRYTLSQLSELERLQAENRYLDTLHQRSLSETLQRHTRTQLAETMNQPGQLPSNLTRPALEWLNRPLPDFAEVLGRVLAANPQVRLSTKQLEAAEQRLEASNRQLYPRLDAELSMSEYARELGSSDEWRAELRMVVPLYENSYMKSEVSKARVQWLQQRAQLQRTRSEVREQALQLWQSIDLLSKRRKQLETTMSLREIELDKNRALYEMEVRTDLGNAMVAISEVRYRQARNEFELALAWMQLRLLMGESLLLN